MVDIRIELNAETETDVESAEIRLGRALGVLHHIMFLHNCRESLNAIGSTNDKGDAILEIKNCPEWIVEEHEKFVAWVQERCQKENA